MYSEIRRNVLLLFVVSIIAPRVNLTITKSPIKVVSKYQRGNWKIYFKCVDLNRDKQLSVADRNILRDRYVAAFNVNNEEKLEMEDSINFFWQHFILGGNNSQTFSEDEFIAYLSKSYSEDENFEEKTVVFLYIVHQMIDVDKDGKISKTEFFELYKDLGYKNRQFAEEFFNGFNPTQNKIPAKQISRVWAGFLAGNKTENFIREYAIKINGLQNKFKY